MAEISRLTGAHPETVRYKIKRRFGRLGFRFHAEVDFAKLGLSLNVGTLNFTKPYYDSATRVLRTLNETGFLTFFAKVVPQGQFIAEFTLPKGTSDQYEDLLTRLRDRGVLSSFSLDEVVASKHKTMDARFFNFSSGRWEVEWDKVEALAPTPLVPEKERTAVDFDHQDLLIIKELQIDARQHLTGIARKLRLHQKALEYHYRTHVQGRRLIPSYRIRWAQDITKKLVHSVATTRMTFRNLTRLEYNQVQSAVSKIPFLWAESVLQDGAYVATMYVPLSDILQVSNYINDSISDLSSKMEMGFIRAADSTSFTIPYNMFHKGKWRFSTDEIETSLRRTCRI